MTRIVELPLWLLVLILGFAAVTFASHFLFPSVRWFFRKRLERAVAKLNERLERPIEPFKLARRYDMVQRLSYDPEVAKAIAEHAAEEGIPEQVAFEKARGYAREIVPRFSATAYFGFGIRIAKLLSRAFYRVRLGAFDEARLKEISADATVVFVIHRILKHCACRFRRPVQLFPDHWGEALEAAENHRIQSQIILFKIPIDPLRAVCARAKSFTDRIHPVVDHMADFIVIS